MKHSPQHCLGSSYDAETDVLYVNFKKRVPRSEDPDVSGHADDSELTDDDVIIRTPSINVGKSVHILGNPGERDLWHWKLGQFQKDDDQSLHIQADVFGGNSGGPVLNKEGVLLGIIARSDRHMNAWAIPARYINQLLSESNVTHSGSRR